MTLLRTCGVLAVTIVLAAGLAAQVSLADRAYNTGFQTGYKLGQADARDGKGANYANTSAYRRATDGYSEDMGSLETYRTNFRAGFEDGYKDGYQRAGGSVVERRVEPEPRPRPRAEPDQPRPRPEILKPRPEETSSGRSMNMIVPEGTTMRLRLEHTLSTRTNRQGDRFAATVDEPVYVSGSSQVAVPAGSSVKGSISQSERPGRAKGTATLHLRFESITLPGGKETPFEATLVAVDGRGNVDEGEGSIKGGKSTGRDTATVGGGAALGAIIGAIAGGGKGAAIGAGVGAAAGTGTVLGTRGKEIDLPGGSIMEVRLLHSLDLRQ